MRVDDLTLPLFEADDPRKFWLAFDIAPDRDPIIIDNLRQGILPGLRGISDSREIVLQWFTIARNALLVMDGAAVSRRNAIRPMPYDDPQAMLANDMANCYRVFAKPRDRFGTAGLMHVLAEYIFRNYPEENIRYLQKYSNLEQKIGWYYSDHHIPINSVEDLVRFLFTIIHNVDLLRQPYQNDELRRVTTHGLKQAIAMAFQQIHRHYHNEAEWIVQDDVFYIPRGSTLIIAESKRDMSKLPAYRRGRIKPFELSLLSGTLKRLDGLVRAVDSLRDIYRIRWVDYSRFQEIRGHLYARRARSQKTPP